MKKKISMFILLLSLVTLGVGCSNDDQLPESASTTTKNEEEVKVDQNRAKLNKIEPFAYSNIEGLSVKEGSYISIIGRDTSGTYWKAVTAGANQAVAELNEKKGFKGKDKVKLVYSAPADLNDVDQQINILDEEMARYPVAIAIAPADMKACEVQFDLATENSISLVTFDTGSQYKGIMSNIGTDNTEAITKITEEMDKKLDDNAKILIVSGDTKLKAEEERRMVYKELLGASDKKYEVQDPVFINKEKEEDKSLEDVLKENTDIKGIVTTGNTATKAVALLLKEQNLKNITVMGFDTSQEAEDGLSEGYIDGIIEQNPYAMGYSSVIAAIRASLDMGNEAKVDTGFQWITKKNFENTDSRLY